MENPSGTTVRAGGATQDMANDVYCRQLVRGGQFVGYINHAPGTGGSIGVLSVINAGVREAVDVFAPGGRIYFNNGIVICLQGTGTMFWMAAVNVPRVAQEVGTYTVPDFLGYTCVTIFEPGTLALTDNPS